MRPGQNSDSGASCATVPSCKLLLSISMKVGNGSFEKKRHPRDRRPARIRPSGAHGFGCTWGQVVGVWGSLNYHINLLLTN